MVIEVAFKGNRKEFYLWELDEPPPLSAAVIVEADRGEDLGRVHSLGELALRRAAGCSHGTSGESPVRKARRLATSDEVRRAADLREQDELARRRAMERVKANGLVMKLSDAEWQWDRKKLTLYFTAEKRVDFRNLVRDLAALFRTRIELKQIGVRDEAKRLDGIGRCGRQYCSASWLPELRPVNLGVAKDQRLSLNPSQISGACGRLMCCLRYEHEFYAQSRKRFPKEGRILITLRGEEKVVANDIFNDRVTLRNVEGESRVVALLELKREIASAGVTTGVAVEDAQDDEPLVQESLDEEVIRLQDTSERPAFRPGQPRPVMLERRVPAPRAEPPEARVPPSPPPAPPDRGVRAAGVKDAVRDRGGEETIDRTKGRSGAEASDAESAPGGDAPRPARRRRGRRGGRRGRGGGTAGGSAAGNGNGVGSAPGDGGASAEPDDEES